MFAFKILSYLIYFENFSCFRSSGRTLALKLDYIYKIEHRWKLAVRAECVFSKLKIFDFYLENNHQIFIGINGCKISQNSLWIWSVDVWQKGQKIIWLINPNSFINSRLNKDSHFSYIHIYFYLETIPHIIF